MQTIYQNIDLTNIYDETAPQDIHGFLGLDKWHREYRPNLDPITKLEFLKVLLLNENLT